MPAVDKLFAFVAEGDGLMAFHNPATGGWIPMVGVNEDNIRRLYPLAIQCSKATGKKFQILLFENPQDVTARFTGADN